MFVMGAVNGRNMENLLSNSSINKRLRSWVRLPVATYLAFGAAWKLLFVLKETPPSSLILESRFVTLLVIQLELALAICIALNVNSRLVRPVSVVLFIIFVSVSFQKILVGDDSCDCFGDLQVPPIVSCLSGLAGLILLYLWKSNEQCEANADTKVFFVFTFCVTVVFATSLATREYRHLDFGGVEIIGDKTAVVTKQDWRGREFPLKDFVANCDEILTGRWHVLFYSAKCPRCSAALDRMVSSKRDERLAVICDPSESLAFWNGHSENKLKILALDARFQWFVEAPIEISLDNGKVVQGGE